MFNRQGLSPLLSTLLLAASVVIVLAGMKAASNLLSALILAILIATLCLPVQGWLEKRLRFAAAFSITFLLTIAVGIAAAVFIVIAIVQVIQELPRYAESLEGLFNSVLTEAERLGVTIEDAAALAQQSSAQIIDVVQGALRGVIGTAATIVLIYLFLFYLLLDGKNMARRVRAAIGERDEFVIRFGDFVTGTQRYMIVRTVFGFIIAALQTGLMLLMGVDFALLWGFLSFICNYIPNVGFIIALIPPLVLIFLEQGIVPTVIFVVLYSVINNLIENFVTPRYVSSEVNLSTIVVFASVIFWAFILGPIGAIIGVPFSLFIKTVLLEADFSLHGWRALLSGKEPIQAAEAAEEGTA
jgi:predicted PurR-regulated permease PerM